MMLPRLPRGVGLPEEVVKMALLQDMSPLREVPVDLHLLGLGQKGKLRVTDPLKSFLRIAEKRLGWRLHSHADMPDLVKAVASAEYPPYFYCVKDRHLLPVELLMDTGPSQTRAGIYTRACPTTR
ncbi:unnamed protein product [Prorocentrum cordatum]|uniref:Uncharacterized protein n=1 Tax=Prorocentrum cordatum TaxID=2364126 RepID=A0ABN9XKU3_9DINO|nr:unnamed protein product [Polarella glacialis]